MSFVTKYRCEFYDLAGLDWKVDFQWDGYADEIINMTASGNPLTYEPLSDSDDLFDNPVRGTKASLKVMAQASFQYIDFFTITDLQVKALIYQGGNLYFTGYVLPKSYEEPYNDFPYEVTISMVDGLAALKSIKYDNAGTPYVGRMLESQIVLDILAKIGVTQFIEIVNIYETGMNTGTDDSPFDQLSIDADLFEDMYCYEVLQYLLTKWSALIRQWNGEFYIYRPSEMCDTFYARTFTAVLTKTDSTDNYVQAINRELTASELRDTNGGTLMLIPPAKKLTLYQDYGYKESWLDNWRLKGETFTDPLSGDPPEFWTATGGVLLYPISKYVPSEADGMIVGDNNNYPALTKYVSQVFGATALVTTDVLTLEFEFLIFNDSGTARYNLKYYIQILNNATSKYLYDIPANETDCDWNAVEDYIEIYPADAPLGSTGWVTWSRRVPGLDAAGSYTIRIFSPDDTYVTIYFAIKNIKFFSTSDNITIKKVPFAEAVPPNFANWGIVTQQLWLQKQRGRMIDATIYTDVPLIVRKQYEVIQSPAIQGEEISFDFKLGDVLHSEVSIDNIVEQFWGALAIGLGSLGAAAAKFVADHAADYLPDVLVNLSGADIVFKAAVAGEDFTGATTCINATGDLAGSVVNTTPNDAGLPRIDKITLSGTSGQADVKCNLITKRASWNVSLAQTADDFVDTYAGFYLPDVIVTNSGNDIIFTGAVAGENFRGLTKITPFSGTLNGSFDQFQEQVDPVARVDTVTLSGTSGTANMLCNAVTKVIEFAAAMTSSAIWNTRGGSEADPLLEIIGGEIGHQFSRPRQMIAGLPIFDRYAGSITPHLNILGTFFDDLNIDGGLLDVKAVGSWTKVNCTLELLSGFARMTSLDNGAYFYKACSIKGGVNSMLSIHYRCVASPHFMVDVVRAIMIRNAERSNDPYGIPGGESRWEITAHDIGLKRITVNQDLPAEINDFSSDVEKRWQLQGGTLGSNLQITAIDTANKYVYYDSLRAGSNFNVGQKVTFWNPFRLFYMNPFTAVIGVNAWAKTYVSPGGVWLHSDGKYRMIVNGWDGAHGMTGLYQSTDLTTWTDVTGAFYYHANVHPFHEAWCVGAATHWTYGSPVKIPGTAYYAKAFQGLNAAGRGEVGIVVFDEDYAIINMPTAGISVPGYVLDADHHYMPGGMIYHGGILYLTITYWNTANGQEKILIMKVDDPYTYVCSDVEEVAVTTVNTYRELTCENPCPFVYGGQLFVLASGENSTIDSPLKANMTYGMFYKSGASWVPYVQNPVIANPIYGEDVYAGCDWAIDHCGTSLCFIEVAGTLHLFYSICASANTYQIAKTQMIIPETSSIIACGGYIYYSTAGHGYEWAHRKNIPTLDDDGDWHTVSLDMSALTAGGTDWIDNLITGFYLALDNTAQIIVDFDWIGFRRHFAFNRGVYDVKNRHWDADLIEIVS